MIMTRGPQMIWRSGKVTPWKSSTTRKTYINEPDFGAGVISVMESSTQLVGGKRSREYSLRAN